MRSVVNEILITVKKKLIPYQVKHLQILVNTHEIKYPLRW
jgi:hypothetical protein